MTEDKTHTLSVAEMPSSTHQRRDTHEFPPGTRLLFYSTLVAPKGWVPLEVVEGGLICEKTME